jgi:hypothetical protein
MSLLQDFTHANPTTAYYSSSGGGGGGGALSGTSLAIAPTTPGTGLITLSNNDPSGNVVSIAVNPNNNFAISQVYNGVQRIILTASQTTGSVTFSNPVFAPNIQYAQTTNITALSGNWGAPPYPSNVSAGIVIGQTYTVPRTGMYGAFFTSGYNVGGAAQTVVGTSDFCSAALFSSEPFLVVVTAATFKPFTMPNTGSDFGVNETSLFYATAGTVLGFSRWATDISTTLNLGDTNGSASVKIIPFC